MQIGLYAVPRPGALDDKSLHAAGSLSIFRESLIHSINMHAAINQYNLLVSGLSSAFLLLLSPFFSSTCTSLLIDLKKRNVTVCIHFKTYR